MASSGSTAVLLFNKLKRMSVAYIALGGAPHPKNGATLLVLFHLLITIETSASHNPSSTPSIEISH